MPWWSWMLVGTGIAVLVFVALMFVVETIDSRMAARQGAIRSRQSAAEQHMQAIVQDTISQMFDAARRQR